MSPTPSNHIEFVKAVLDHLKHLTTVSSGFILVMAALLERLFSHPEWKFLIVVAFSSFVVSILFSLIAHAYFIDKLREFENAESTEDLATSSALMAWGSFLIGVIALSTFAVKNFM